MVALYPEPLADTTSLSGNIYRLGNPTEAAAASLAYIRQADSQFTSRHYKDLSLTCYYWLHESIHGDEEKVVASVASGVHALGRQFYWVPFYTAWGVDDWRKWGFDKAWLQPNFFFDTSVSTARLPSAVTRAEKLGLGFEIEFNGKVFTQPPKATRLAPYLQALEGAPDLLEKDVLVYDGAGALIALSKSSRASDRELYSRLVRVLTRSGLPNRHDN